MCLDHPKAIRRAAVVDILPNRHIWRNATADWAMRSWHWLFMAQPADMPERMMGSVPAEYFMTKKLSKKGIGLAHFSEEAFKEYVRCFTPKTIHASCEDYRACPTCDRDMDEADYDAGLRVACPLLVLWGAKSHTGGVFGDVLEIWRDYAANTCTGGPLDCGHYVPEEAPDATLKWFLEFFDRAV
jgi:haloacetate dehalogenase